MHEHVIKMTNIATTLKSLEMAVDENFLVQFIMNSLPTQYGLFQMNYNTTKYDFANLRIRALDEGRAYEDKVSKEPRLFYVVKGLKP